MSVDPPAADAVAVSLDSRPQRPALAISAPFVAAGGAQPARDGIAGPTQGRLAMLAAGLRRLSRRHAVDTVLAGFALLQLWPFLAAFHQTADDNFWQYVVLSSDTAGTLMQEVHKLAVQQGRVGMYLAMPLVLLGAMLPEFAWGRLLIVACFGLQLLGFCHLLAHRFGLRLTRPALLLTLCLTPMAAHHLPPNAYPLMLTLPILGLVALHLRLASPGPLSRRAWLAAGAALVGLTLMLEYALVAGAGFAAIAVLAAKRGERRRALWLHGPVLAASAAIYFGYRAVFPSHYDGNAFGVESLGEVAGLQLRHIVNGTMLPYLAQPALDRPALLAAAGLFAAGCWLAWRLLPGLARALDARIGGGILLACLGWAWLNTLPHALSVKYQAWWRVGDCTYVDSRIASLSLGIAAAVGLALLLRLAARRPAPVRRAAALLCAAMIGGVGALGFLHNRAAGQAMAAQERGFALMRSAACQADPGFARDPRLLEVLSRGIWWHLPPADVAPAPAYLAAYRDALPRLNLSCRPIAFAPAPPAMEFTGWAAAEPNGRWSLGPGSLLRLVAPGGSDRLVLAMAAYVPPGRAPQRVTARLAGGPACSFTLDTVPKQIVLPHGGGGDVLLLLDTPDAVSPSAAGQSADTRVLGAFLFSAQALRAGEAPEVSCPG